MDRPSRKKNVVNYCESKDFDNDDEDFACVKTPPNKKAREDVKQDCKKSSSKSSSQESNSQSALSQKKRKPLDVKLYERDLEAAITLSLLNPLDEKTDHSPASKGDLTVQHPVDENIDPSSLHFSNCSVDSTRLGLDQITSEKDSPALARQRNTAPKATEGQRSKFKDEDDDYQPKLTPESESDDDFSEPESEDEEFMVKKASKTKKEKVTKNEKTKKPPAAKKEKQPLKPSKPGSQAAVSSAPVRSPPVSKSAPEPKRSASSSVSMAKPVLSQSPAGGRIPKWNPPGQIGKGPVSHQSPTVKSPGQGLRLGLSRLVRVKPLHPSVASH
ncbi:RAD51-associated protein 1 [Sphaeramia orbicularis]|uniref:RAD51-associated protein 1 n=1 Tax=Sphaeramia orbicularis TaxID=375764 RepID=UPI001180F7E0|nr:RAD51-associated protein 1 [Sphaeramia orbicularis]